MVRAYVEAFQAGDARVACALITEAYHQRLQRIEGASCQELVATFSPLVARERYEIKEDLSRSDSDTATIVVWREGDPDPPNDTYGLVREGGRWLIDTDGDP